MAHRTKNALKIIDRMIGKDFELRMLVAEANLNVHVAEMILSAREKKGLTQSELAKSVGTTQSVIARLEDADYEGRSLSMLSRIAAALGRKVDIRLIAG